MPKTVSLKVQPRTGFDKSFQNLLTMQCGTLVPLMCDEVIPNTTVHLNLALSASLPPLASDTFMRVQLRAEAFFIPFRLLCGGYESWQTRKQLGHFAQNRFVASMPHFTNVQDGATANFFKYGPNSLSDYLGYRFVSGAPTIQGDYSMLPFLAYHRIWNDWYRNPSIQNEIFYPFVSANARANTAIEHIPYVASQTGAYDLNNSTVRSLLTFRDNIGLFELRQRNFDDDYFTVCKPSTQLGPDQGVSFDTSGSTGSMTIAALREANSLQQYLERNQILGYNLKDYNKGQYDANLSDGVAQRALYLGSASYDVYSKGIYQTNTPASSSASTQNPFGSVGARFGSANAGGNFGLIDSFTANESGYIFVMLSLVPKVTYGSGILPMHRRYVGSGVDDRADMANPILQNIGNAPVFKQELDSDATPTDVFGYTDRYASFMTRNDEVHGLLVASNSLESFALQRTFKNSSPAINSAFLRIPTTYLDNVAAVQGSISQYGCWVDSWLDYKVAMPLARYSIPSLQNPAVEHGHTVNVVDGGTHI